MLKPRLSLRDAAGLVLLTFAALLIHGYHLGVEDQAIYLPAIKRHLDPSLYPHDAAFFLSQTRWTLFDESLASFVRFSRIPLEFAVLLFHALGIFLLLFGCLQVSRRVFPEARAQWAGVALVASVLTLPVAGTLALMADPYLHPRIYATALSLFALAAIFDASPRALLWLALAAVIHPQVTLFAVAHLVFQAWPLARLSSAPLVCLVLSLPQAAGDAWREVMLTRRHHFPLRWTWYEWLGAIAPVFLLGWFARLARRDANLPLARSAGLLALSCALGTAVALTMNLLPALVRFMPTQPMRHLHLVYVLLFLYGGGLLGRHLLGHRVWRWAVLFVPVCAAMFFAQQAIFPRSPHIEWPDRRAQNPWLEAFAWVRQNTPRDALFALDPRYKERGADHHGFRALAERSMLADYTKDRGVAAIFPDVAARWKAEVEARRDWARFRREDFLRLRREFQVSWVIVDAVEADGRPAEIGLPCPFAAHPVRVCRVE